MQICWGYYYLNSPARIPNKFFAIFDRFALVIHKLYTGGERFFSDLIEGQAKKSLPVRNN